MGLAVGCRHYYVCFSSFWIVSEGHFSWLHGLSAFTIVTVTLGLIAAVRRNIPAHRGNMVGSYIGIAVAFGFAVSVPGRAIPGLLAEDLPTALYVGALVALSVAVVFISLRRGERRCSEPGPIEGFSGAGCGTGAGRGAEIAGQSGRERLPAVRRLVQGRSFTSYRFCGNALSLPAAFAATLPHPASANPKPPEGDPTASSSNSA